jgi:hypothetical protein
MYQHIDLTMCVLYFLQLHLEQKFLEFKTSFKQEQAFALGLNAAKLKRV